MFKRMQKLNDRLEKDRKKGYNVEDQGPPEMALDDESDSEDSSSSSSGGSESSNESEGDKTKNKVVKKEVDGSEESDDDSDSSSSSDDDDNDEKIKSKAESSDDSSSSSSATEEADDAPPCSIDKAMEDPIFIHPRAASKAGFTHRSCYLCPLAILKNEKGIVAHTGGMSHARRRKRFVQYCSSKLKAEERKAPEEGGLDVTSVVQRIDKALAAKEEKQMKHRAGVKLQMKEAKRRRMTEKKEKKQIKKAEKEERKQKLLEMRNDPSLNPEKIAITADGETVRERKKAKAKRQKKLTRVLPPKAERKAAKKARKEVKMAARKEAARLKAKDGAAKNKATATAAAIQA